MSDLRPDQPHISDTGGVVRDAKIEELLLTGLDHYFAGQYEQAVNVWTRVLFLDRGHARARAYIERARSAIAERQRESEELLQGGIAAFQRGETDAARELLDAAVERGGPSDLALAFLSRLKPRDPAGEAAPLARRSAARPLDGPSNREGVRARGRRGTFVAAALVVGLIGVAFAVRGALAWRADANTARDLRTGPARPEPLLVPRPAEGALARARAHYGRGHLNEALVELDRVPMADALRPDADKLKAEIQKTLIDTATLTSPRRP